MLKDAPIHPSLATKDLAKARSWYADKIGWEPALEPPGTLVYQVGQSFFTVYESEYAGTAKNTVAIWRFQGVRPEVERLKERGVVFEDYDFGPEGKTVDGVLSDEQGNVIAWFKDSEGNILGLTEDKGELAG